MSAPFSSMRIAEIFLVIFFLVAGVSDLRGEAAKDHDLKAVFLFNFVQFVDWPPETFSNASSPIIIGIFGDDDPIEKSLNQVVRGEMVRGRKLVVKQFRRVEEIDSCQILFISKTESAQLDQLLSSLKGKPVLTVGESDGFALSGGMIRFLSDQNKIRLRINKEAVNAANLAISSKLLKAAHEIVETVPR